MSRAALLPTPGDPFLLSYWLRNFRTWAQYVDQLYVCISWPQTPAVDARLRADIESVGGIVVQEGDLTEHGWAMKALLKASKEDVLMYVEDDFYVREPEIIDQCFRRIENDEADIVGIPRGSMGQEILAAGLKRYPPRSTQSGPALWPNMLFSTADRFRAITEPFSARSYKPGDTVVGVGYVVQGEHESADTFGAAAMEMQDGGARLHDLPEHAMFYKRFGPYIHIGSLSSGPFPERCGNLEGQNPDSWAIRTSQWRRFHRTWPGGLDAEHAAYGTYVERLEGIFGHNLVDAWAARFDELLTWSEV